MSSSHKVCGKFVSSPPAILQALVAFAFAMSIFSLSGCDKATESKGATPPPAMPATPVVVAPVRVAFVKDSESFVGMLKALKSVIVRPQVEGIITQIFVQSGNHVSKGTRLVEIDNAKQREALASRMASRESLQEDKRNADERHRSLIADRQAKVANLDFARSQYERYKGLRVEGAVAQESVDQYFNQLKSAEAELSSIDAQIRAQEAMINKSEMNLKESRFQTNQERVQLDHHTAVAPFAGMVGDVPVRLGQYVETSTELTTIDQSRPLEVYVYVPADQAKKLKIGLPIEMYDVENKPLGTCPITFISPEVGTENQSVLVKGLFDNPGDKLRSNQQVTTRIVWQKASRMLVPTNSVVHISGQDFVFVARPGATAGSFVVKQLPVFLGDIHDNAYVVMSGMTESDRVVVSDVQRLFEGMPIAPTEKSETAASAEKAH